MRKWMSHAIVLTLVSVLLLTSMAGTASAKSEFLKEGTIVGKVSEVQLKGSINGIAITGYTFRDSLWIPVSHLSQYGFDIQANGNSGPIRILRNTSKPVKGMAVDKIKKPTSKLTNVHFTQKDVLLGNRKLTTYQIDNSAVIRLNDLALFGEVLWNGQSKTLELKLGNMEYENTLGIWIAGDKAYNRSDKQINEISIKHFFMYRGNLYDVSEVIDTAGKQFADIQGLIDPDSKEKLVDTYIGSTVEYVITSTGDRIDNPYLKQDSDYYKSKTMAEDVLFQLKSVKTYMEAAEKEYYMKLKEELKNNGNRPLKFVTQKITYNRFGSPEVNLSLKNLTEKKVVSFELTITGYDGKGRIVKNSITGESQVKGRAKDFGKYGSGDVIEFTWVMDFYNDMVKANAKLTSVKFSDGTVWRAK